MAVAERALTAAALVRRSSTPSRAAASQRRPVRFALLSAATSWKEAMGGTSKIKGRKWQERAWDYYDTLGEIHYAADFFGANLGRIRLIVQKVNAKGEWEEVTDGPAADALEALRGPRGGREDLQKAYGEIHFLVGEGYLFGALDEGTGEVVWEFLSGAELQIKGDEIVRKASADTRQGDEEKFTRSPTLTPAAGEAVALRLWTPHPKFSADPEAPMMAVLDACEELKLLPRAVRSRARSRLASAGILAVPNELTTIDSDAEDGAVGMDEDPQTDPLLQNLIETASTAISDEESAAAAVPIVVRADGEHLKGIQHVEFVDPSAAYPETERENHVIRRIAQGLKLPPEVLQGMADANHWSAWQISEAIWTQHIEPVAQQFVGDLTSAYLAPLLGDRSGEFRVWYDDAGLVVKPDRTADALEAHDRLVISDAAYRDATGFDETDAPDDAELTRRIGVKLGDAGLAIDGEVTTSGGSSSGSGDGEGDPPAGPGATDTGPPDTQDEDAATAGAVRVALARCREAAGARVRTRLQRERDAPSLNGAPNHEVCAALGRETLDALDLDADTLVRGGAACLTAAGYPPELAAQVERHAARTLYERRPLPLRG